MKLCILAAVAVLFVVIAVAEPVPQRYGRGVESKDRADSDRVKSDADKSMQKPSSLPIASPPSHPDEGKQDAHTHRVKLSHHSSGSTTPKPRVAREADSKEDKSMEDKSKEGKTDADAPIKKLVPLPIAPRDPNSRVRREPYTRDSSLVLFI